jgi:hypothetical protein
VFFCKICDKPLIQNCLAAGYRVHFARFCTTFSSHSTVVGGGNPAIQEFDQIVSLYSTLSRDNSVQESLEPAGPRLVRSTDTTSRYIRMPLPRMKRPTASSCAPRTQVARLAHVNHLPLGVLVEVHARLRGKRPYFFVEVHEEVRTLTVPYCSLVDFWNQVPL